jgi:predicted transcriptional regulator
MSIKNRDFMEEMTVRLFGSTSRPRILGLLLSHPQQTFYQREVMYGTGLSLQTVQRELENLRRLGILKKRETKGRIYYQTDTTPPWFRPLKEICEQAEKG